jgi:DNA mismatch repair protein MutL
MSIIKLLPEHLIDQIKAGEIIERPASLIKELLENSLDAQATIIKIHIVQSGLELISIEDNGKGMSYEDLPLAFHRHATSKLSTFNDLYHLNSFGFRGEALASMAAIAKIKCETSQGENKIHYYHIDGGETIFHHSEKYDRAQGTSLYIKNLFFNTPARLKFVQSLTQEKNQIKKTLNGFILSNPEIQFEVKWDDSDNIIYPASTTKERFAKLLKENIKHIQDNKAEYNNTTVKIYFNSAQNSFKNLQFIFVNSRIIMNKQLHSIITNYFNQLGLRIQTDYILFINTPSINLDVNIHPHKTQIKFLNINEILSLISNLFKNKTHKSNPSSSSLANSLPAFNVENIENSHLNFKMGQNLPTQQINQSKSLIFNDFGLIIKDDHCFILNLRKLLDFHIKSLKEKKEKNIIPLLVSQPLKDQIQLIDSHHEQLHNLGFEIDKINSHIYLVRSYEKSFAGFPLDTLIYFIIEKDENHFSILKSHALALFDQYTLAELTENNIIWEISSQFLKMKFDEK